jgi:hypothetical protein
MAELIKQVVVGLISILEDKRLQVREDTVIYEGAIEISRTFSRYISTPGDDLSSKPQIVQDVAGLLWTPEFVAEWKEKNPILPPPTVRKSDV